MVVLRYSVGMRAVIVLGLLIFASSLSAAEETIDENLVKLFEARVYREPSGASIPYRLFKPKNYDAQQKYPLVLFLHGAVGAGTDNRRQFNGGNEVPPKTLTTPELQATNPCFIFIPQCPGHSSWSYIPGLNSQPTEAMRLALGALSQLQKEFLINNDRLYILGISMGGHGVWDAISRHPNLVAAAVPICSGGDTSKAKVLTRLPVWCFHGDADPLVPVQHAREMIAAIKRAGGNPKYTEYPGVGHNSYVNAFKEPELLPWLFSQKRSQATAANTRSK